MSDLKTNALKELVSTPKDLNKLILYEANLKKAYLLLLFDCRTSLLNSLQGGGLSPRIDRLWRQLKTRLDSLIDRARYDELRFRPGTAASVRKTTANNCLLYNFIIFSRAWDLKDYLKEFDSLLLFSEEAQTLDKAKSILRIITDIDDLLSNKENVKTNIQSTEEVTNSLYERFNRELELAETAGALKGIIKLEKPKLLGKSKYFKQLGSLILKVAFSFGIEHAEEPISLIALTTRLNDTYPRVRAEPKDIFKAVESLAENGFLYLTKDEHDVYWISLKPSESEANVILSLAEKKGSLTLEEVVRETNWSLKKAKSELDKFVTAGCAIKDDNYSSGLIYYFPALQNEE